jgi:hypothetical protein
LNSGAVAYLAASAVFAGSKRKFSSGMMRANWKTLKNTPATVNRKKGTMNL